MAKQPVTHSVVRLPAHPFFYTLDQVAILLSSSLTKLRQNVYFVGRTSGPRNPTKLEAINIAEHGEKPDWRINERELIRWLGTKGQRIERDA